MKKVTPRDHRRWRRVIGVAFLSTATSGCLTSLGYVPDLMKPRSMTQATGALMGPPRGTWSPTYPEVKEWAYDVADGYSSRSTMNRYALYWGAFVAAAGAGALTGLGAFAPGSGAITGIPIGTGFTASVMAYYENDKKAAIYDLGSARVRDFIARSDARLAGGSTESEEAVCLQQDVGGVIDKVSEYSRMLDPKNVVDQLKAVRAKTESGDKTGEAASAEENAELTKVLDAAAGDFSGIEPPARSVCEIAQTLQVLDKGTQALERELQAIPNETQPDSVQRRDRASALKEKADRLKPQADGLVTRAMSVGNVSIADQAQDLADRISTVQKSATQLAA